MTKERLESRNSPSMVDARIEYIGKRIEDLMPPPTREELAAFADGFQAALAAMSEIEPKFVVCSDKGVVQNIQYEGKVYVPEAAPTEIAPCVVCGQRRVACSENTACPGRMPR